VVLIDCRRVVTYKAGEFSKDLVAPIDRNNIYNDTSWSWAIQCKY